MPFEEIFFGTNGIMYKQNFNIVIGDTFFVENVKDSIYTAKQFYKNTLTSFMKKKYKNISLYYKFIL